MGLVHRQARIPISGFGCPKMHAMVGVSLSAHPLDSHPDASPPSMDCCCEAAAGLLSAAPAPSSTEHDHKY